MADTLFDDAARYADAGFSVIPMRGKKPAVRWKRYQQEPPTKRHVRRWFHDRDDVTGVAVIFGRASGNLGQRDFDSMDDYQFWKSQQPELAAILPTVATSRGRHVYFGVEPDELAELRERLGKPNGNGAIKLPGGELRADVGCYSVLPRSRHPSGAIYEWLTSLPDSLPVVPLAAFVPTIIDVSPECYTCNESGDAALRVELLGESCDVDDDLRIQLEVEAAIKATLPTGESQRNHEVFQFTRHLKAIPSLATADPRVLEPCIKRWYEAALPFIDTKEFEVTRKDFFVAWKKRVTPAGMIGLRPILARAFAAAPPSCALRYAEEPKLQLLVAICREMQRVVGDREFFLSCAKATEALELPATQAMTVWRWFEVLKRDGVLRLVEKGTTGRPGKRKASKYRYLGDA